MMPPPKEDYAFLEAHRLQPLIRHHICAPDVVAVTVDAMRYVSHSSMRWQERVHDESLTVFFIPPCVENDVRVYEHLEWVCIAHCGQLQPVSQVQHASQWRRFVRTLSRKSAPFASQWYVVLGDVRLVPQHTVDVGFDELQGFQ